MTPNLERMIEDLEEKNWYIIGVTPGIFKDDGILDRYYVVLGTSDGYTVLDENNCQTKSTFATIQDTFKLCVEEAWKRLV